MDDPQINLFEPDFNRSIKVQATDQRLTSNAGVILLRDAEHRLGLIDSIAQNILDPRDSRRTRYGIDELIRERVFTMATTANETIIAEMSDASRRNTLWTASKGAKEEKSDGDSLAAVATACQNGDCEAYRQLNDSCHQSVFRLSVRMVGL